MSLKKGLILLGLIFLLTSIVNANEAQDLLRKARDEYYKSIEGQEKAKKEAARLEKERIAKEEKAAKEAAQADAGKGWICPYLLAGASWQSDDRQSIWQGSGQSY